MKKFHQTTVLNHFAEFANPNRQNGIMTWNRTPGGLWLMYEICKTFNPKSILEIGFGTGLTLGLMIEACDSDTSITTVDIDFQHRPTVQRLFANSLENVKFVETDSRALELSSTFDLVLVDGNHSYEYVTSDLNTALAAAHDQSIICVDDFPTKDVGRAISDIMQNTGWKPFIAGFREIFFYKSRNDIDSAVQSIFNKVPIKQVFGELQLFGHSVVVCNMDLLNLDFFTKQVTLLDL